MFQVPKRFYPLLFLLMIWHRWRAAVWLATMERETYRSYGTQHDWYSRSPKGVFAQILNEYHSHAAREAENILFPSERLFDIEFDAACLKAAKGDRS